MTIPNDQGIHTEYQIYQFNQGEFLEPSILRLYEINYQSFKYMHSKIYEFILLVLSR
jgi:hypothetical protein